MNFLTQSRLDKKKKKYRLLDLELDEISIVDSAANPHADVMIVKRMTDTVDYPDRIPDHIQDRKKPNTKPKIPDHIQDRTRKEPYSAADLDPSLDPNIMFSTDELDALRTLVDRMGDMLRVAEPSYGPDVAQANARDELQYAIEEDRRRLAERENELAEMEASARSQQAASTLRTNQGVAQADQQQANREAEEQARQDRYNSTAARNNADLLSRMSSILEAHQT